MPKLSFIHNVITGSIKMFSNKGEGKVHPRMDHEGLEGE